MSGRKKESKWRESKSRTEKSEKKKQIKKRKRGQKIGDGERVNINDWVEFSKEKEKHDSVQKRGNENKIV